MKIHVISIGGRIMHNLAIDMKMKGHVVSGSDDEIYEPSRSKLKKNGLLPESEGWDENRIDDSIDLIILGMHAKKDNPELIRAQELNLKILSYPKVIFEFSKDKKRVVVAGSHGKTTTTAMIMHVLKKLGRDFDYLIGANLDGFESMVKLTDAELIIIEGDEYLSSPIDRSPKMLHYQPHVAVITGIAWDHINVFPSFEGYKNQFVNFVNTMNAEGVLFFYKHDAVLMDLMFENEFDTTRIAYGIHPTDRSGKLITDEGKIKLSIFGEHNIANLTAAMQVCGQLGIEKDTFISNIVDFKGAEKRLEVAHESEGLIVYRDFAHAPSKVKATVNAIVNRHINKKLKVIVELHTYSSLNINFLPHYKDAINEACSAIVYYNEHTLKMKRMDALDPAYVAECFAHPDLKVITSKEHLASEIEAAIKDQIEVLAILSSGNLTGLDLESMLPTN